MRVCEQSNHVCNWLVSVIFPRKSRATARFVRFKSYFRATFIRGRCKRLHTSTSTASHLKEREIAGCITFPRPIIFWLFLVIRVVQGESLVGDRQWWTTKPYVWWQLLLAKLLFVVVFICVPLFHVQLFLLHHFKFPILRNLLPLFWMQLSLFLILLCLCVLLASLTKNLVQVLLVVGAAALTAITAALWSSGTYSHIRNPVNAN